ncbi:hypothetical protein CU098_007347, partial [Rhizopus stolonifer]
MDSLSDTSHNDEELYYEKCFCDTYMDALRCLSKLNATQAFQLFELIARHGRQVYNKINSRTQQLVSFAQYRAGRMLCELDDSMEEGLGYLLESSKNGNARATFILGYYAERRGDIDHACHLYHQAAVAGVLPAKVSFGNTILFKKTVPGFQTQDAIQMLDEASIQ